MIQRFKFFLYIPLLAGLLTACQPQQQVASVAEVRQAAESVVAVTGGEQNNPVGLDNFTSTRYRYSIAYSPNWVLSQAPGDWRIGEVLYPDNPGADTLSSPDLARRIVLGRQPLPSGVTLDSYASANLRQIQEQLETCGQPETSQAVRLGEEPAQKADYHCTDGYYLQFVFALHHGDGFVVAWTSPAGHEADDRVRFTRFLTEFAFDG